MKGLNIELVKLFKRKSSKVLMVIYAIVIALIAFAYFFGEKSMGISIFSEGQFLSASLGVTMAMILPFISLYLTSTSFAIDFSTGAIKNIFLLPMKKGQIFINKLIAVQVLLGVLLSIQFVFTLVFSLLLDGGFSLSLLITSFSEYLGAFFVLALIALASASLSLIISSTGLTILSAYLIFTGIGVMNMYLPRFEVISFTRIVNAYHSIFREFNMSLLLSLLAYYILLYITGTLLFDKKEESVCQYE